MTRMGIHEQYGDDKRTINVRLRLEDVWVSIYANPEDGDEALREQAAKEMEMKIHGEMDLSGAEFVEWEPN